MTALLLVSCLLWSEINICF